MDTTSIIFEKLNRLLEDNFPFKREDTVVCMDLNHIKILRDFMREHMPLKLSSTFIHLSNSIIYLPVILDVIICSKNETKLIEKLSEKYNIVIMASHPFEHTSYHGLDYGIGGFLGYIDQTFGDLQILMNKDQLWKLDSAVKKLKDNMSNADQGHLKFEDLEMIWDQNSFSLKLFGVGNPNPPQPF